MTKYADTIITTIGMMMGTWNKENFQSNSLLNASFKLYVHLDWSMIVLPCKPHHDQCHHYATVEDGTCEPEKVDQRRNVSRNDHEYSQETLQLRKIFVKL